MIRLLCVHRYCLPSSTLLSLGYCLQWMGTIFVRTNSMSCASSFRAPLALALAPPVCNTSSAIHSSVYLFCCCWLFLAYYSPTPLHVYTHFIATISFCLAVRALAIQAQPSGMKWVCVCITSASTNSNQAHTRTHTKQLLFAHSIDHIRNHQHFHGAAIFVAISVIDRNICDPNIFSFLLAVALLLRRLELELFRCAASAGCTYERMGWEREFDREGASERDEYKSVHSFDSPYQLSLLCWIYCVTGSIQYGLN